MKKVREGYARLKNRKEKFSFLLVLGFLLGTVLLTAASLIASLGWFGFLGALVFFGFFVGLFLAMVTLAKSDL